MIVRRKLSGPLFEGRILKNVIEVPHRLDKGMIMGL